MLIILKSSRIIERNIFMRSGFAKLMVLILISISSSLSVVHAQEDATKTTEKPADAVAAKLYTAKETYKSDYESAKKTVLDAIDKRISDVSQTGNFDVVKPLVETKKKFEAGEKIDCKDKDILKALDKYSKELDASKKVLQAAFKIAVTEYTKAMKLKEAEKTDQEADKFIYINYAGDNNAAVQEKIDTSKKSGNWQILLRGNDPSIWNTDTSDKTKGFAIPISKISGNIKYLKIKKMDADDFVIVPMTKENLLKQVDICEDLIWNGQNNSYSDNFGKARTLGLANKKVPVNYFDKDIKDAETGVITYNGGHGLVGYAGWGFSRSCTAFAHGGQRFQWKMKSCDPVIFEISVNSLNLSSQEKEKLLVNESQLKPKK